MNDKNVNISLKKLLENPSNRFLINGSNNNQIIGTNIHINHYTLTDKPKIKKVVEDHQYDANISQPFGNYHHSSLNHVQNTEL